MTILENANLAIKCTPSKKTFSHRYEMSVFYWGGGGMIGGTTENGRQNGDFWLL